MKQYYLILTCIIIFINPFFSYATPTPSFSNIVFLGDSLSDNGNLYNTDFGLLPKSPPYFHGRFTNGDVWSDYISRYFRDHYHISSVNYAVGGETVNFHNPLSGFLPYTLTMSLYDYLLRSLFADRSTALFFVWAGANDYLHSVDTATNEDMDQLSTSVVNNIRSIIEDLIYHGGKNFIVINLPDFARTPFGKANGNLQQLTAIALMHNLKLDAMTTDIRNNYKQIRIQLFDLNRFFVDFIEHTEKYNQKYHIHVTDVSSSCWHGGYSRKKFLLNQATITQHLEENLQTQARLSTQNTNKFNITGFAQYIAITPTLLEAYKVGENAGEEMQLCDNPEEHMFWDKIHPSAVTHSLMAQGILDLLNQYFIL